MTGRDRLRELLDAVLDDANPTLARMAGGAFLSPYHFSRELSRGAYESPVAMRRRVLLERAAWQLREGTAVTAAAWAAGYDSVEGFSRAFARAFGHPPSDAPGKGHWLPAPNGIHFHPPMSLWVRAEEERMSPLTEQLVRHDLDDTAALIDLVKGLDEEAYHAVRWPGRTVLDFDGPEESIAAVLERLVFTKEVWLAAVDGRDFPADRSTDVPALVTRLEDAGARWLAWVRDVDRRGGWDDRLIDALCDPPESFVVSGVVAHVLEYSAHRRQSVRAGLREAGLAVDQGDPITWLRHQTNGERRRERGEEG